MTRRAVLIGINRYRIPGADLRGCVNDVKNMRHVLMKYFGFKAANIRLLTDFKATRKAMQQAIAALIGRARKGDVLFLHYSGHGSNVPDRNGDEADRRDEILCPTDLDWKDPLTDDWLRRTINTLKSGARLTVVMDCCHSGTNTRAILRGDELSIERYLPSPWDLTAEATGRRVRGTLRWRRAARRRSDLVEARIPEVLITGCRDTQTSADAYIGRSYNGALTYALVSAIRAAKGKLSNRELHASAVSYLKREHFSQIPQLEARKSAFDRPFLA